MASEDIGEPIPGGIDSKVKRGRDHMKKSAPLRNLCFQFWRGKQYTFISSENFLVAQSTVTSPDGTGKPRHRIRQSINLLKDPVRHEVAYSTQRVPSYEVAPTGTDPGIMAAAMFAEKAALYLYEHCRVKNATKRIVTYAVVADEGFAWPYFDPTIDSPRGEICIKVFGPNEVYWEPDVRFEDSRWHCVEQARPLEEVMEMEGYLGGELSPDASSSDVFGDNKKSQENKLVLVSEYLERPSMKNPAGRRIVMANKRMIVPEEPYPCVDGKGNYVDEPVLHKLAYTIDPDNDRDLGLVRDAIDPQRSFNDAWSKVLEFKNLALIPRIMAPTGSMKTRRTDEPGAVDFYDPVFGMKPEWSNPPSIPPELFQIMDRAEAEIARIFAQNDIPNQVDTAQGIQALLERDQNAREDFIDSLADFHSRLMRHMLYLVQRHYTEDRLLNIQGRIGRETVEGFLGANIKDQCDVRVSAASLAPRTKASVEQKIMNYAQLGWISPHEAMAAIDGGTAQNLAEGYELQIDKQWREIQSVLRLAATLGPNPHPTTFAPAAIPEAKPYDDHSIHREVLHQFFATVDFERQPEAVQEVLLLHDQQHQQLQAEAAAQQAQAQLEQAQGLGMGNAAKPQGAPPLKPGTSPTNGAGPGSPSLPSLDS